MARYGIVNSSDQTDVIAPQDILINPITQGLNRDEVLARLTDREAYVYNTRFLVSNLAARYTAPKEVPQNANFWFSNITAFAKNPLTGADNQLFRGILSIIDLETGNRPIQVPLWALRTSAGQLRRTFWPLPYVIRAGQTFQIELENNINYAAAGNVDIFINVEGWHDYSI